jgi:hypothetical protein
MTYVDENDDPVPMPDGSTARMQVRDTVADPVLAELTTENGYIVLNPTSGVIQVIAPPEAFVALESGAALRYDLILAIADSVPQKIIGAEFLVEPTITHD